MKKLLAILLTLIFAFSCFGTLGTTAMAEEARAYRAIVEKGFKGWTTTAAEVNGNADCVEFNTEEGTASLKAGNGSKNTYIKSPTIQIVPDREYELSLYVRSENASTFTGNNSVVSPLIGLFVPYSEDAVAVVPGNANFYAYTSGNVANRTGFKGTWQVEGYAEATINNFSLVTYSGGAAFSKILGGGNFQDGFGADWKKITFKFKGMASSTNSGPQYAQVCIGFDFKFASVKDFEIDVKDVELKEFCKASNVLFESDLNEDGNLVAFDGNKVNQDTEYVKFADEVEDDDYIEIRTQPKKNDKTVGTAVATAPFNVYPNNEYEITYDFRIPADSASYVVGDFSLSPEWWIYEVDQSKMDGYKVGNRSDNDSAYAYKGIRRDNFEVSYTYAYENGETIATLVPSRTGFSFMDFKGSDNAFNNQDALELFKGEWITVTIKFTGVESAANKGAQLCALAFGVTSQATVDNTYFQVKDIQVKETAFTKTTPVYNEANGYKTYLEDYEFDGLTAADVLKFYGGKYNTAIDWTLKASKIEADENGNNVLGICGYNGDAIYLPITKGTLAKHRNLKVSFDWMFKNTGASYTIEYIELVGYNNSTVNVEGNDYPCISGVQVLSTVTLGEITLDDWSKTTLKLALNSNLLGYDNYAVRIKYKAAAEADLLYIDNLVVEDGGKLVAGDYDNNGEADLEDLTKLAKYLAGWTSSKLYVDDKLADYNGDGATNLFDLVKFAQDEAGWTPAQ